MGQLCCGECVFLKGPPTSCYTNALDATSACMRSRFWSLGRLRVWCAARTYLPAYTQTTRPMISGIGWLPHDTVCTDVAQVARPDRSWVLTLPLLALT